MGALQSRIPLLPTMGTLDRAALFVIAVAILVPAAHTEPSWIESGLLSRGGAMAREAGLDVQGDLYDHPTLTEVDGVNRMFVPRHKQWRPHKVAHHWAVQEKKHEKRGRHAISRSGSDLLNGRSTGLIHGTARRHRRARALRKWARARVRHMPSMRHVVRHRHRRHHAHRRHGHHGRRQAELSEADNTMDDDTMDYIDRDNRQCEEESPTRPLRHARYSKEDDVLDVFKIGKVKKV